MTSDRRFDALLRSWLEESAPSDQPQGLLESVVTATAHTRPRPGWLVRLGGEPMPDAERPGLNRFAPLALAATALIVALLIGVRVLVGPPNVGPTPIPGPSHSTTLEPNPTPRRTEHPAGAWFVTGGMVEAGCCSTVTLLLDGRVLAAGGSSPAGGDLASAELYDPSSGTWAAAANMITIHYGHTATRLLDGRVLVAGGGGDGRAAEVYDPRTGSWAATGDMVITVAASPRATLLLDGRVLVTGVTSGAGEPFASAAQLYDPTNGSWSVAGTPIEPRYAYTATRLTDGKVLVAGGAAGDGAQLTSAELYDPINGSWTATGSLIGPHADGHTATLLMDGKVLMAGGYDSGTGSDWLETMTSAELYDPSTESWTATGSLIRGHGLQTATLLPDGEVLVVGDTYVPGVTDPPIVLELYDPSRGKWGVTASPIEIYSFSTSTLLLDGRVLVTGIGTTGAGSTSPALAELYDPGSPGSADRVR